MGDQGVERRDVSGIASIVICRPSGDNSLDEAAIERLGELFAQASCDPQVRGIVLGATGRTFVSGADASLLLRRIERGQFDQIVRFIASAQTLLTEIDRSPKPVVARVGGAALGGGLELALACDRVVASTAAVFAFPETGLGIYPTGGGTQRTPRRIGSALAKWLILTGSMVSAADALAIGLIDRVVSADGLERHAAEMIERGLPPAGERRLPPKYARLERFFADFELAGGALQVAKDPTDAPLRGALRRIAGNAPLASAIAGRLVEGALRRPLDDGLRDELEHVESIYRTQDAHEGLSALQARRRPRFEGR